MTTKVTSLSFPSTRSYDEINHFKKISTSASSNIYSFLPQNDVRMVILVSKTWQERIKLFYSTQNTLNGKESRSNCYSSPMNKGRKNINQDRTSFDTLSITFSYLLPLEVLKVKSVSRFWFHTSLLIDVMNTQHEFICGQLQISMAIECLNTLDKFSQNITDVQKLDEFFAYYQGQEGQHPRLELNFYFCLASFILINIAPKIEDSALNKVRQFFDSIEEFDQDNENEFINFIQGLLVKFLDQVEHASEFSTLLQQVSQDCILNLKDEIYDEAVDKDILLKLSNSFFKRA